MSNTELRRWKYKKGGAKLTNMRYNKGNEEWKTKWHNKKETLKGTYNNTEWSIYPVPKPHFPYTLHPHSNSSRVLNARLRDLLKHRSEELSRKEKPRGASRCPASCLEWTIQRTKGEFEAFCFTKCDRLHRGGLESSVRRWPEAAVSRNRITSAIGKARGLSTPSFIHICLRPFEAVLVAQLHGLPIYLYYHSNADCLITHCNSHYRLATGRL
jgi:hypothetical protein